MVREVKYGSYLGFEGIKVKGPKGEKLVEISGDKVEVTPSDSFGEGVLKGIGRSIFGSFYPFLTGIGKSIESYSDAYEAAKEVGLGEWGSAKAGLKAAFLGGIKGFAHGFIDSVAIGGITVLGGLVGGPLGAIAGATLGAGIYNVVKDAIRHG
ncbi:MAG: hypothetical protein ABDH21_00970 [bacterium]